ncbi:MAG: ATP-binding protein, partial [Gammaproteobacteria bacterium]|nr:ATP-binding protein [Gammaproteobacteria bacterium]
MTNKDKPVSRLTSMLNRLKFTAPHPGRIQAAPLMRWRSRGDASCLEPIRHSREIRLEDLLCIERQKAALQSNTEQFINDYPANNVLLWGPRGTGKSSLVKAVFSEYRGQGLRLVEVTRDNLADLHDICDELSRFTGKFIIFCDDLSFDVNDPSYKTLKVLLDGSVSDIPDNILIYATSNRRHLIPEYRSENLETRNIDGEIHHGESVEEKLSLSERFGIWLSFHPFNQEQYLQIAFHWLRRTGLTIGDSDQVRQAALQWALEKGTRSGRSAAQFARDWAG